MKPTTRSLMVILVATLAAACGDEKRGVSPTGPTESGGIVVERTTLRSKTDCDNNVCFDSCDVEGTVRNDTATDRKVTLTFAAFDGNGRRVDCFLGLCGIHANGGEFVVPAGGRTTFRGGISSFSDCDNVARLEITELKSEPVA